MDVGAGLAELIGQHAGLGSCELECLFDVCGRHYFDLLRGQSNAAASATPRAPVTTSFSSRPTGAICTACVTVPELTVPRHRGQGPRLDRDDEHVVDGPGDPRDLAQRRVDVRDVLEDTGCRGWGPS